MKEDLRWRSNAGAAFLAPIEYLGRGSFCAAANLRWLEAVQPP